MIEGLLPGLVALRRSVTAGLQRTERATWMERYTRENFEHETLRLGCSFDILVDDINAGISRFYRDDWPMIGVPLELCPTCCRHAAGRIKVVFVRNPKGRLASFYKSDWLPN